MSWALSRGARLQAARWLFAASVFGSAMAIGAMHLAVLVVVTLALFAATVLAWWGADPLRARRSQTLIFWTGVLLTAWTALAVVPLRPAWLSYLSPHAADVWARCLVPLGRGGPSWVTLSLDPVATRIQVLRGVAYVLAFATAARIATRRQGVVFLERTLIVTALALAAAALLHPALGAEKVFGIYTPRRDPGARHVAPILNANVLAGYLNVGLSLLVGQALDPRSAWPRSLLAVLSVVLIAVQVWVASRGGVLAMVLSLALVVWMVRTTGAEMRSVVRHVVVPSVLVALGVVMMVLASSDDSIGELATTEMSKLDLSRAAFRLVPRFPLFGVGRGAFETVFPAFRTDPSYLVYTHPEDLPAQWITEWGLPVGIAAFLVLAVALRPATAIARSPRAAGAWAALGGFFVHDLVDFGSEYPAVIIALSTCAAIVTGGTSGVDESRRQDAWARRPNGLVLALSAATVLGLAVALPCLHHELYDDRVALHAAAVDPHLGRAQFDALAEAAMLRHPAEPYLPYTGAIRSVRAGDESPLPWIERTDERAKVYGPVHLLFARWLTPRSPSQARLEYRLAIDQAPELTVYMLPAVPLLVHDYDDALEILPEGRRGMEVADMVGNAVAAKLPATAHRLDDLVEVGRPNDPSVAARRARDSLDDVLAGADAPWCAAEQRATCVKIALDRAAHLIAVDPDHCAGYAIRARLLVESDDATRAILELRSAADRVSDRIACLEELADLAARAKSDEGVTQALDRVSHAGCKEAVECVRNLQFVASREQGRGNDRRALAALEKARLAAPADDALVGQVADLASKLGNHVEALRLYEGLAARHRDDARWQNAVTAEKAALVTETIP